MVILLGATAWTCLKNSPWGFLGAWFFLILAPSSSVIPLDSAAYEHRMYLSLAAVIVLGVMGIYALIGRRTVAVAAVLAIALGVLTWRRNQDYRSDMAIWQDTVAKCPNNPRAQDHLGIDLEQLGKMDDAMVHYEQALRIAPDFPESHYYLGVALIQAGRIPEAIDHLERTIQLKPGFTAAHFNLGVALAQAGRMADAIEQYEQAVRLAPNFAEAHLNLGVSLGQMGKTAEAIEQLQLALRIKPDLIQAQNALAHLQPRP
jgi:tetratricopeptide (TPR) repeat protein